jgi:hypothetical protein
MPIRRFCSRYLFHFLTSLLIVNLISLGSLAQEDSLNGNGFKPAFIKAGLEIGLFSSGASSADLYFRNSYYLGLDARITEPEAENTPADYIPGGFLSKSYPHDKYQFISLIFGKLFFIKSNAHIIIGLGPSWSQYNKEIFEHNPNSGLFTSNYIIHSENRSTIGITFKITVEVAVSKGTGIMVIGHSNQNSVHSFTGINLGFYFKLWRKAFQNKK